MRKLIADKKGIETEKLIKYIIVFAVVGIVFFILPFYFLLNKLNLGEDEKLAFSFFIGAGIFPAIVYWLGIFISFKISIFITFISLIVVAFILNKYHKNKKINI